MMKPKLIKLGEKSMSWNGEEYSRRLRNYSDDTMLLISECNDRESFFKSVDIVMEEDSEAEVQKKLKVLIKEKRLRSPNKIPTEAEWKELRLKAKEDYLKKIGKLQ